jgi:hypothetical protein
MIQDGRPYINIDTTTDLGIQRAHSLGFHETHHLANVVISPLVLEATGYLFTTENKAILFALMRHPVARAISQFYYIQGATWGKITVRVVSFLLCSLCLCLTSVDRANI